MLPEWNRNTPFNITRASHVVLTVKDLDASRAFYEGAVGLVVSKQTEDTLYLRGLEEACHHSLVLRKTEGAPAAERIGMRIEDASQFDALTDALDAHGVAWSYVDVPFQGKTLHFTDPVGMQIEITSEMDVVPRHMQDFHSFRSGALQRMDHYQVVTHDVQTATEFWSALGFRMAEFTAPDDSDELWGTWLERKGNTHDLVFTNGKGPRLHHFAYTVPDASAMIHACDSTSSLGYNDIIDRGPGRHGLSNALFVYFRDPDGHRIELFTTHYQYIDLETPPIRWSLSNPKRAQLWGMPASERWFFEASAFAGAELKEPLLKADVLTLEKYLEAHV